MLAMLATARATMNKVLFAKGGPKCLDGTQAGYYLRQNTNSHQFVIFLQGGGLCFNAVQCTQRKKSMLGSSKKWSKTMHGTKLISENAANNPDFSTWNHIYVPYCSGDTWLGLEDKPTNPFGNGSDTYTFSGHKIIIAMMSEKLGLDKATHVLLTGTSAGGMGSFHHADWLTQQLPNAVVKTNPEAGWFGAPFQRFPYFVQNVSDPDPKHLNDATGKWLENINHFNNSAIGLCLADPSSDDRLCPSVPYFYPYIKSPIFVTEAAADKYQINHQAEMPDGLNATEKAYIIHFSNYLRGNMKQQILKGRKANQDGIFTPACFRHGLAFNDTVEGHTWPEALGNWFFGRSGPTQLMDDSQDINTFLSC